MTDFMIGVEQNRSKQIVTWIFMMDIHRLDV